MGLHAMGSSASGRESKDRIPGQPSSATVDERALGQTKLALPQDLSKALKFLDDEQVERLLTAVLEEAKRRGMPLTRDLVPDYQAVVDHSQPSPAKKVTVKGEEKGLPALTKGQINAVNAAFRAGVTPSQIARQFGLSKA
jgi:hypothetical protein